MTMPRPTLYLALILAACACAAQPPTTRPTSRPTTAPSIEVHFAPGDVTAVVVAEIAKGRQTIDVRAYALTSTRIAKALVDAKGRGVAVRVLMDEKSSHGKGCVLPALVEHGVECWTDGAHPIAHMKAMTIDGKTQLAGSYNWSEQASRNAETMLVIHSAEVAAEFLADFEAHLRHAKKVE